MKKSAFTLAEVLITLGVIGVVAAVTMPSVIQSYKERQTVVRLKKAYSIFDNAFRMAINEKGMIEDWGLTNLSAEKDEDGNYIYDSINSSKILFEAIKPYLKLVKTCAPGDNSCITICEGRNCVNIFKLYSGILADGSSFYMFGRSENCSYTNSHGTMSLCGDLTVDIDGPRGKNTWGKDIFRFNITPNGVTPRGGVNDIHSFTNYCKSSGTYSLDSESCTAWIIYNENMDYLHCDNLSWEGKHTCK